MHLLDKWQYKRVLLNACRSARETDGSEICGLIIDTGRHISFVTTRNVLSRAGGFVLSRPDVRRIAAAVKILGQEIVGTFHSHTLGIANPGKADIEHAVDDSLMFIFDCTAKRGGLWRIKGVRARSLPFGSLRDALKQAV